MLASEIESAIERSEYVAARCGDDSPLLSRVKALLAADESPHSYLDQPAAKFPLAATEAGDGEVNAFTLKEGPGSKIGRYKLLQEIGTGGFGIVYMAEQQEPVRRTVALKIIKPGMDTREVIARFEAERQALALMDHPNIARVLDAGATDSGRPYFVMELVKGVPVTEFCDKNNFSTAQRLKLLITICQAVQHAHQKGVIHRDLKPSNVMVTLHDGKPVPKVIDFGISKAISSKLTEKTLFTRYGQMIGTPQYMSPEQAEMSGLDVDTRSDVYSLGVMLYELLTGSTPLAIEQLRDAGYGEVLRLIQESEAPKPSTRLSTLSDRLTVICKQRSTNERALSMLLRGDLDWIVMKALEKDRSRRYDTANALAEDITRHLNDEPVLAGAPSSLYLAKKLIRRNRGLFAASLAIAASLLIGCGLMLVGLLKANREARDAALASEKAVEARNQAAASANDARREADNARQVLTLISDMLEKASPEENANKEMTVRQMLGAFTKDLDQTKLGPDVEAEIRLTIGKTYLALSSTGPAQKNLHRAYELRSERTSGHDLSEILRPLSLAASAHARWAGGWSISRYDPAVAYAQQSLELEERFSPESVGHIESLEALASILMLQNEYALAEKKLTQATRIAQLAANRAADPLLLPTIRLRRIECLMQQRPANFDGARVEALDVVGEFRRLLPEPHPKLAQSLVALGNCQLRCGLYAEAETSFLQATDLLMVIGSGDIATCRVMLSEALQAQDRYDEAKQVLITSIGEFDATSQNNIVSVQLVLFEMRVRNCESAEYAARRILAIEKARNPNNIVPEYLLATALFASGEQRRMAESRIIYEKNFDLIRQYTDLREPDANPLIGFACSVAALADVSNDDLENAITAVAHAKQIVLGTKTEELCEMLHAQVLYNHGRKPAAMDVLNAAKPSELTSQLQFEYLIKDAGLEAAMESHRVAYQQLCNRYGEKTFPIANYQWFVAKNLLEQGHHGLAIEPLLAALDYFKTHGQVHHFRVPICLRMLSEIYIEIGDREKAADSLTELEQLPADYGNPILDVISLFEPAASPDRP